MKRKLGALIRVVDIESTSPLVLSGSIIWKEIAYTLISFNLSPILKKVIMDTEKCCPDYPSKKDLLPWLMVVLSTDSLQPSASRIASGATSPKARIFWGQLI